MNGPIFQQYSVVQDNQEVSVFDSARSLDSFFIPVTEDGMQFTAEALSRIRVSQRTDSQETVRKMAAMKTEWVIFLCIPLIREDILDKIF